MPKNGDVTFNQQFFNEVLRSAPVEKLTDDAAQRALAAAKASAPVDSGAYRDKLRLVHRNSRRRRVSRVLGTDAKTMLIESKTGNLARALKAARG
ncbi:hypothetical protein [Rathayibacter sp. VKM Ac-2630]|uniref:hypothetical protein n=1 Tax=Rathayibacter sp. VKM Ac-2630 TaxID=1938617 RepID=UPI000981FCA1|nr:hypothetical protein [Rathayibacter sp. VKM Ac-2630]OOB90745.1 hypothetical protein B0T42_10075 [Rathayibacter sp. VKM Ac-2630]